MANETRKALALQVRQHAREQLAPLFEPAVNDSWREGVAKYFEWSERLDRAARNLARHFHRSQVAPRRFLEAEGIPLDDFEHIGSLPPGVRLLRHALRNGWKSIDIKAFKTAQVVSRNRGRVESSGKVPAAAVRRTFILHSFLTTTIAGDVPRKYPNFSVYPRYVRLNDLELTLLHIYIFDNDRDFWLPSTTPLNASIESVVKGASVPMWKARMRMEKARMLIPTERARALKDQMHFEESQRAGVAPPAARFGLRPPAEKYRLWTPPDIRWHGSKG